MYSCSAAYSVRSLTYVSGQSESTDRGWKLGDDPPRGNNEPAELILSADT